ncbi:activator of mitotic machinery Cdc14 phosphatase activation C-term-domain-containing protein [Radiomyces spectabilis]|uniref:activator of mitotic machinery Cdc14 phosphatase activation C-term-domain-containing protein n=1 Tax=Radiomyces spectabilis TaxID=64574 RepID=UPI00221E3D83|nr:activator of mitotic machinery Cdc14 phosphatase activation C-term-domain-containing protein [Radiomyces spectabilis]KAI8377785.1 activator of mitotic machinery Cdc14 phosphatase activation C-term-domain-containing protein [Radiomyces spectabilis]
MPKSPSLSRRQAVSMKYSVHGSRSYREILQQRNDNDKAASDDRPSPISPEGVTLYDRPVSISEWVDFGNADGMKKEYEPHKLLSRLYEPESSPVESTPTEPNDGALLSITEEAETSVSLQEPLPSSASSTDSVMNEIPRDEPNIVVGRTPSKKYSRLKRSLSERLGFRSNRKTIFGSLFQDKRNKTKDTVEEPFVYRENRSMERPTHRLSHTVQGPLPRRRSSVSAFFSSRFSFRSIMRNRGSSGLQVSDGGSEEQEGPNASCYTDDGQMSVALERAMYRLSHFKLGNQRRPLRDQVLISNLMFWYLSTLNIHPYRHQPQSTSQATSASQEPHPQSSSPTTPSTSVQDNTIPTRSSTDQPGRGNSRPKSKKNIDKYKPVRNTDYVAQQRADSINTSPPQSPL